MNVEISNSMSKPAYELNINEKSIPIVSKTITVKKIISLALIISTVVVVSLKYGFIASPFIAVAGIAAVIAYIRAKRFAPSTLPSVEPLPHSLDDLFNKLKSQQTLNSMKRPSSANPSSSKSSIHQEFQRPLLGKAQLIDFAIINGHMSQLDTYLNQGFNPKEPLGEWYPLHRAAFCGRAVIARLLIEYSLKINHELTEINATTKSGKTPLSLIFDREGNKNFLSRDSLMELFLEKGANPNIADNKGYLPLHYAIEAHFENIAPLVEKTSDINALTTSGFTALGLAIREKDLNIIKLLVEQKAVIDESLFKQPEVLQHCIKNVKNKFSHAAIEVMKFLIENSKDAVSLINTQDGQGCTPLDLAISLGHVDMVKLLIANGANTTFKNNDGQLPIENAQALINTLKETKIADPVASSENEILLSKATEILNILNQMDTLSQK